MFYSFWGNPVLQPGGPAAEVRCPAGPDALDDE